MPDLDFSKWPVVYQLLAFFGAALAGAISLLMGSRKKNSGETTDRTQAKLDTAELRRDFEEVLRANREAAHVLVKESVDEVRTEVDALERRVRQTEIDIAVLKAQRPHSR